MTLALPRSLMDAPLEDVLEAASRESLGVWTERKRDLQNGDLHWEWCELAQTRSRLCVVAPREHAKSEVFTVNQCAWRCTYTPGIWCYVFANSGDQAAKLLERIVMVMRETANELVHRAPRLSGMEAVFNNGSRVSVAGSGKAVRGAHPDLIIGDDVLEDGNCGTAHQRRMIERWWLGTVAGMSHPGTWRPIGPNNRVWMPPTKVFLVGTPFHQQDLLMNMRENPMYEFRRYAAEFGPHDLVDGMAVEIG